MIGRLRSPRGAGLRRRTCGPISNRLDPLDRGDNQPAIRGAREGRDPRSISPASRASTGRTSIPADGRRAPPLRTCLTFFVAEGRLPSCQSTPLARRVRANRPPPLRMRSLWTGSLLAPRDFLRRPPSVGTCPPVMTYKANPGRTRPFHFSLVRRQEKAPTGPGLQGNDQQSPARRNRGGSENLRCALSALPSIRFRLIYGSREGAYSRIRIMSHFSQTPTPHANIEYRRWYYACPRREEERRKCEEKYQYDMRDCPQARLIARRA